MKVTVGTSAVLIPTNEDDDAGQPGQVVVLQNLGPGDVYVDGANDVDTDSGLKVPSGAVYEFPRTQNEFAYWMVASEAATDVRVLVVD